MLGNAITTLSQSFPSRKPSLHYVLTLSETAWLEKEGIDIEICTWKMTK